jgi:hypothetical protein
MKVHHPDLHEKKPLAEQALHAHMAREINKAYDTLSDRKKRAAYDGELARRLQEAQEPDLSVGEEGWGPPRRSGPPRQPPSRPKPAPPRPAPDPPRVSPDPPRPPKTPPPPHPRPEPVSRPNTRRVAPDPPRPRGAPTPPPALGPSGFPIGAACPSCGEPLASEAVRTASCAWDRLHQVKVGKLVADAWYTISPRVRERVTRRWEIHCRICAGVTGYWVEGTPWPTIRQKPQLRAEWWRMEGKESARRQAQLVREQARLVELERHRRVRRGGGDRPPMWVLGFPPALQGWRIAPEQLSPKRLCRQGCWSTLVLLKWLAQWSQRKG